MGLDQYAFTRNKENCVAEWRKHARLQEFMERLWVEKTGTPALENPYHADTLVFLGDQGYVKLWWKHVPVIKPALVREVAPHIVDDVTAEVHHKMIATIRT